MKKISFLNLVNTFLLAGVAQATELYVAQDGSHLPPFETIETAATNLQVAVDAADSGDVIRVAPGIYNQGSLVLPPSMMVICSISSDLDQSRLSSMGRLMV